MRVENRADKIRSRSAHDEATTSINLGGMVGLVAAREATHVSLHPSSRPVTKTVDAHLLRNKGDRAHLGRRLW
jgi:hypothetical protein